MGEPFIGEIKIVGFPFAPENWSDCHGQTMSVSQNQALYALLYDQFGGDGRTTFKLPDMRGRVPMHPGGYYRQGYWGGAETVAISPSTFPKHTHTLKASSEEANAWAIYSSRFPARSLGQAAENLYTHPSNQTALFQHSISEAPGGSLSHANMQPSTVVRFVIALQGIFPPRN